MRIVPHKDFLIDFYSEEQKSTINSFIDELRNDAPFITCHTSGSTGSPKAIRISKEALVLSAENTIGFFDLKPKYKASLCISVDFIAGKMMLVRALIGGMHLEVYPANASIGDHLLPSDFIALFPIQLQGIMNTRGGLAKLKQCRNILIGGAQISKELEKELIKNKITVYQSYGMTETVSHIALKKTGYLQETHYKAIEGVSFKTLDDCLIIHYPKMSTTVIKTNDLVELKDAHHFKWIGRNDFVINSGGYKISPEIIEDKIQTILSNEILLTGINDSEFGEKVGLIIKGKKDSINIRKADLKSILHPYEIPKMVTFISSFERTSNGKLDRKKTASKIKKSAWQILL